MKKNLLRITIVVVVVCCLGGIAVFSMGLLDPYHSFCGKWKVTVWDYEPHGTSSMMSQIDDIPPGMTIYFTFTREHTWTLTVSDATLEMSIHGIYIVTATNIYLTVDEENVYPTTLSFSYSFTNRDNTLTLIDKDEIGQIVLIRC